MIVRLIASGVLLEGGYLFWDEPEANLNPSSQKAVAHALKHLADQGSQIFVATHSMFLLRELQMSGGSADTRYIGLERRRSDAQGAAAARWLHNQATISMTSSLLPHSRPRLSNLTDTWLGESRVTSKELLVDGTFFTFPPNWQTEIFDEWPQYKRATGELELRGCDVLALDGQDLWIIEMKDYTYDGASQPQDLHKTVGQKAAGTMALLFALSRTAADSSAKEFAIKCASSTRVHLALHVIVKDGGSTGEAHQSCAPPGEAET